jgi:hypothetical protein
MTAQHLFLNHQDSCRLPRQPTGNTRDGFLVDYPCEHTFVVRRCHLKSTIIEVALCTLCHGACPPEFRLMTGWLNGKPPWRLLDNASPSASEREERAGLSIVVQHQDPAAAQREPLVRSAEPSTDG